MFLGVGFFVENAVFRVEGFRIQDRGGRARVRERRVAPTLEVSRRGSVIVSLFTIHDTL